MTRRTALFLPALAQVRGPAPIIVDTDAGSDDLLAIAFLLARPDVSIEAITVVNGLAHVEPGAANVCRLLTLAGKRDVSVYMGQAEPSNGNRAFPAEWRRTADELPGVRLPVPAFEPERTPAPEFLAERLGNPSRPVRVLAVGPLTNFAAAFRQSALLPALEHLVIMGGALRVRGNLGDGGAFHTANKNAEWNIFIDPSAAETVFNSRARIMLIPLDATSKVPVDLAFLAEFQKRARTRLGQFAAQILESDKEAIQSGYFQAWDPLAAVALLHPSVVTTSRMAIEVLQAPGEQQGRTVEGKHRKANVAVALDANRAEFKRRFLSAFE
ncbi:MAG: nucleoside hydrolase [Acidobacteriota bacterium]|nr:nucleoside hydrolase [Acidobacteriota bacterium]